MTKISKVLLIAALLYGAGTIYSDSGFALGSDSNSAITANDIIINPALINNQSDDALSNVKKSNNVQFISGTGDFEQSIPAQINPEIGTPEYEAAQIAAQEAAEAEAAENSVNASSLYELVKAQDTSGSLSDEMKCLAGTVYFESKGESLAGQLAVAKVVLARAESGRFPNSICGVVYQRKQFSFVRGGKMPKINKSRQTWRNAVAIAKIASNDHWDSEVEGALFFHASYVSPGWKLQRVGRVDKHIFYR